MTKPRIKPASSFFFQPAFYRYLVMVDSKQDVQSITFQLEPFVVLDYQKVAYQLEQAGSVVDRVKELVTVIGQKHENRQQRVREIEARMNQLAHQLKDLNLPPIRQKQAVQPALPNKGQDQLHQYIQQRGEFLRRMVHDLKSNFSLVQGAASFLNQVRTDGDRAQMMDMLTRNLQQASQLLTQLLDIARLEASQEYSQVAMFGVAKLLTQLVEGVQPLANKRGLWARIEGVSALLVKGDATNVYRISQNILLNAINYIQEGGITVRWESSSKANGWQLTITDTGPGLADGPHSLSGEGIGLIIVRELCILLDGQLQVDSQAGIGTQFTLSFLQRHLIN